MNTTAVGQGVAFGDEGDHDRVLGLAFQTPGEVVTGYQDIQMVSTLSPLLFLFQRNEEGKWIMSISEPTQTLESVWIRVVWSDGLIERTVTLPSGSLAGSTLSLVLDDM